jgi:glycolate oxidase FAD binding subunit
MEGPAAVAAIRHSLDAAAYYDWGGGLVWLAVRGADDAGQAAVRAAIPSGGGHATLIRATAAQRSALEVFQPQEAGVAALSRRVKEGFDPNGILNTGRMYAGV